MSVPRGISSYLNDNKVPFEAIHHRRDYTAQQTAADTHTKGKDFAKTVILYCDNSYCMVVLPAIYQLDIEKFRQQLDAADVSLATEEELREVCPDCEVGAMPPFGSLYRLQVYVDKHLTADPLITFNAGTHEDVIRMSYEDFEKLVKPKVLDLAGEHV